MALDANGVPDVDASAGMPGGGEDGGGPSISDMEALMSVAEPDAPAGDAAPAVDVAPAAADAVDPAKPADAPAEPAADAAKVAADAAAKKTADDAAAAAAASATTDEATKAAAEQVKAETARLEAETVRLRKGFQKLAADQEKAVNMMAKAKADVAASASYREKAEKFDSIDARIKSDPLGFLVERGGEEIVDAVLQAVVAAEESPEAREVKKLRKEIEAKETKAAQDAKDAEARRVAAANQQALDQWRADNLAFASLPDKAEAYDMINTLGLASLVHDTAVAYYNQHKVIPDRKFVADHVEKQLRAGIVKSKYARETFGAAAPGTAAAATPAAGAKTPQGNGTEASKKTGGNTVTLAGVATGDAAPAGADALPENDSDERFAVVLGQMAKAGELPDEWRSRN